MRHCPIQRQPYPALRCVLRPNFVLWASVSFPEFLDTIISSLETSIVRYEALSHTKTSISCPEMCLQTKLCAMSFGVISRISWHYHIQPRDLHSLLWGTVPYKDIYMLPWDVSSDQTLCYELRCHFQNFLTSSCPTQETYIVCYEALSHTKTSISCPEMCLQTKLCAMSFGVVSRISWRHRVQPERLPSSALGDCPILKHPYPANKDTDDTKKCTQRFWSSLEWPSIIQMISHLYSLIHERGGWTFVCPQRFRSSLEWPSIIQMISHLYSLIHVSGGWTFVCPQRLWSLLEWPSIIQMISHLYSLIHESSGWTFVCPHVILVIIRMTVVVLYKR